MDKGPSADGGGTSYGERQVMNSACVKGERNQIIARPFDPIAGATVYIKSPMFVVHM